MAIYVLTGGATGIGAAIKNELRNRGDEVFVIDVKDADCITDLSTPLGREEAINKVKTAFPDGIDGFIPCAGLGPSVQPPSLITKVNFFGARALVEGLKPLLEMKQGSVVIISSNSAPMGADQELVEAMLANDEERANQRADQLANGQNAYGGSKLAITRWMRKASTEYAQAGIRMNAVAPGIIKTALTDHVLADKELGPMIKAFGETVPMGNVGKPEYVSGLVSFLLSPAAYFICGSVIFVDGGHDAMLRPEDF